MPAPLEAGTILIASLGLEDPPFTRTVVLLLQHVPDEMTLGVIINRPLGDKEKLYPSEELESLTSGLDLEEATRSEMFYQGGPVEPGSLIYLHRIPDVGGDATTICPGLFAGGDLDALREHGAGDEFVDPFLRFFLGYAEWAPGQLEAEIALGAWILAPAEAQIVFSEEPDHVWQDALRNLGAKSAPRCYIPEDASGN